MAIDTKERDRFTRNYYGIGRRSTIWLSVLLSPVLALIGLFVVGPRAVAKAPGLFFASATWQYLKGGVYDPAGMVALRFGND